jgi:isoquinoline 1-oxidoreductase subunit alpha
MAIALTVNGEKHSLDIDPDTPLLWVVRDTIGLTGSKFGCGIGYCGACTMHINGKAERTCIMPVSAAEGATITTIEGLAKDGVLTRVQQTWLDQQVPQCGYCQSGMIMAVSALLAEKPHATDEEIDESITNICRCGTFARVRKAIRSLAASEAGGA